jgi:hypothetical protein
MHLLKQKWLSGHQARWMEALGDFSFEIIYIEGTENILADALSRLYANDSPGTVQAPSEFTQFNEDSLPCDDKGSEVAITAPLSVGLQAAAITTQLYSGKIPRVSWSHLQEPDDWENIDFVQALDKHIQNEMEGEMDITNTETKNKTRQCVHSPQEMMSHMEEVNQTEEKSEKPNDQKPDDSMMESTPGQIKDDLMTIVSQQHNNNGLLDIIKNNYANDPFFSKVLEAPRNYHNFINDHNLLYIQDRGQ